MRRGILSFFLALSMCFSLLPAITLPAFAIDAPWEGSGTASDPYLICSRDDLKVLADAVNSGEDQAGVYFEMTKDIDLGGESAPWPTIGITIDNAAHQFRGVFDGGHFTITGLYVNRDDDDAGLFGYVGQGGVIRCVNVYEPDVSGTYWCGVIASRNYGLIEYCSTTGGSLYSSQQFAGGIVGDNHGGVIRYCYNKDTVIDCGQICGGIAGRNSSGTVENCYNTGDVYTRNVVRSYAGGVVGENTANSTIDNCYSTGWVDGRMASGAIAGANGEGSSVTNCYYPDSFEEGDLPGLGSSTGNVENVTPKSEEDFASGEVAWELSKGNDGEGWGQTLDRGEDEHDKHPHFTEVADKPYETTPVYRVTFKSNNPKIDLKYYVDPEAYVDLPESYLPAGAKWYEADKEGNTIIDDNGKPVELDEEAIKSINRDIDAIAGIRLLFRARDNAIPTITAETIYSPKDQALALDLDEYMEYQESEYAENSASAEGRFRYEITGGKDKGIARINADNKTIIIPAATNANEEGYELEITAREKKPNIVKLAATNFGLDDVKLNVKIIIHKADPVIVIKPDAADIYFGNDLSASDLTGGEAQHPTTGTKVNGKFSWDASEIKPTVTEAASVGYYVIFEPDDTTNYNTVTTLVTLNVSKIDPEDITLPEKIDRTYTGSAQDLIIPGGATGGIMKYWLTEDPDADPPTDSSEYSSTIPSRANVGTYFIYYMVIGDENHNDTEPGFVTAKISPAKLEIDTIHVTYNGSNTFTIELNGVEVDYDNSPRTVFAYLTANSENADTYEYTAEAREGKYYTIELSNGNYIVADNPGNLIIDPLPVVLAWQGDLAIEYDGKEHTVTAKVMNGIGDDAFDLEYANNQFTEPDLYEAKVTDLGNTNYTMDGAQNLTQPWRIFIKSVNITLYADTELVYGDDITLTADFDLTETDDIDTWDGVEFYVNGKPVDTGKVTYSGSSSNGTATVTIPATAENNFSAGANIVRAQYGSGDSAQMDASTVIVAQKPIIPKIEGETTQTYDGNEDAAGLKIELYNDDICDYDNGDNGKDDVYVTAGSFTYDDKNAGENKIITAQNVALEGAQSGNYVIEGDVTTTGTILPKVIKLEWKGSTGLYYTGNPVNVTATALELIPGDECDVEVTNGDQINVGNDYIATAELKNPNYTLPDEASARRSYNIFPATVYIPEQTVTYNGEYKFEVKPDGATLSESAVSAKITAISPNVGVYTYSLTEGTENSEDKIYWTLTIDNPNYKIGGGAVLTIEKAPPTYTAPTAKKNLIYNKKPQELIKPGSTNDGVMMYSLSEEGPYSEEIPTGIVAGTYTVWYIVVGDENHYDIGPESLNVTISKRTPDDPDNSDDPGDSGNSGNSNNWWDSADAGNPNSGTDKDSYADVSSASFAYAADEEIGISGPGALYVDIVLILAVPALIFILKKNRHKGRH